MVLGDKRIKNLVILAQGKLADEGLCASYMLHQEVEHDFGILGAHHQLEYIVVMLASLLVLIHYITTYEQEHHKSHKGEHCQEASEIHDETDDGTDAEGYTGCDKPSTDDGENTGDTEHCTLATPGTVGKRCTHCHHKGDVGGGERQLIGSTYDYQHRSQHEVDSRTHNVEGCSVGKDGILLAETGVEPLEESIRNNLGDKLACILRTSHNTAGGTRGTEHLVALVLT